MVNVTYSYSIVERAANAVKNRYCWKHNEKVQQLKFSNKWIKLFLKRGGVTRRKITREDKAVPSDQEIHKILSIGQKCYIEKGHSPQTCFNFDETAFTYAIGPTHNYCPINQPRATNIGISNAKLRITAVIAVNALGEFAPLMLIVKHSVSSEKRPDQTGMTVIRDLHKKEGFRECDGWILKIWQKEITLSGVKALHKIIYIIHVETGHVITSQVKAWNDTVRMVLWFKVIIKTLKEKLGKILIWCDNCGSHKTSSVSDVINEIGADVCFLPKNMTGELQVLDLVVNGPLKAHIRTIRANRLYGSFQEYKMNRTNKNISTKFEPPKPTMIEAIKDLILLFTEQFTEAKFKDCINRTFIKTGTLPTNFDDNSEVEFVVYKKESLCGTMVIVPEGTLDLDIDEEINIENSDENALPNDLESLERAVINYDIDNQETIFEENDTDESDYDSM